MPQPIITPSKWLGRDALSGDADGCSVAIVGFCRFGNMKDRLSAETLSERCFSHLDQRHQFIGQVDGKQVLALECLYGGPMAATVIEELAHYGITRVVGYGYAGSISNTLRVGQVTVADSAIPSDGTSREYLPEAEIVRPVARSMEILTDCAAEAGIEVRSARVWTTDAIYREYPAKIERWKYAGADVVNMDTGHFYAVSQVVGLSAIYACVISDDVSGSRWDDGFARIQQGTRDMQGLVLNTARRMLLDDAAEMTA